MAVRFGALKSFNFLIQVGGRSNLGLLAALVFYSAVVLGRGLRSQVHTISLVDYNFWGIYLSTMNLRILKCHDLAIGSVILGLSGGFGCVK